MANKPKALKSVETLRHTEDKRKNIPTAEHRSVLQKGQEAPRTVKYPRNTDLDPQLVWRGKDEQDWSDLVVHAPPLYIQIEEGFGLQVEFESFPDIELAFESLTRERSGIELLNIRHQHQRTLATVFVPDGKLEMFENLIRAYLDESKDTKSGPKNRKLLNAISEIRAATLNALWTDDPAVLPSTDEESLWWEVWLPVRGDRAATTGRFKQLAEGLGFQLAPGELQFPERTVLLAYGSAGQMKQSILTRAGRRP